MRDKGIKIRDTLKQHILNNKKEYIVVMLFLQNHPDISRQHCYPSIGFDSLP